MKIESFQLELITPCFCGGAEPEKQAEIRAPSIRGQLRWWFRTLGGFKSLAPMSVRDQEAKIFGSMAGDEANASKLVVRVIPTQIQSTVCDGQALGHQNFSDAAYLTFPIQSRQEKPAKRGVIRTGTFELVLLWRGEPSLWGDLKSLVTIFGNLGALGFRGRRAMGALALKAASKPVEVGSALGRFVRPNAISAFYLPARDASSAITCLGRWLRKWRSHGRTQDHSSNRDDRSKPPLNPGFDYAKRDHDIGYGLPHVTHEPSFRPALGLPIIQRTGRGTRTWNFGAGRGNDPTGRFASPVLLRPHRDSTGVWRALVIFLDAHQWPTGRKAHIDGQPRAVFLDLYQAMKADRDLASFIG